MNLHYERVDRGAASRSYTAATERIAELNSADCKEPTQITALVSASLKAARCGAAIGLESGQVLQHLALASQGNGALFAAVTRQVPRAPLGDHQVSCDFDPAPAQVHVIRWLLTFFTATVCRDHNTIAILRGVSSNILKQATRQYAEYAYLFVDGIQAYLSESPHACDLLLAALEAADPKKNSVPDPEMTIYLDAPLIALFWYGASENERFEQALIEAISNHKEYWTVIGNPESPVGYLSIELCGVGALAFDRGMKFIVESDYAPMSLIRGDGLATRQRTT